MKIEDVIIKFMKNSVPSHELAYMLQHWFKRSEEEIARTLEKHRIPASEIHNSLVHIGMRQGMEVDHKTLTVLVHRLKTSGVDPIYLNQLLSNAGFMQSELKTLGDQIPQVNTEINTGQEPAVAHQPNTAQ